jgi:flagellar biosynthesis/type III secretory pathway protein FliH
MPEEFVPLARWVIPAASMPDPVQNDVEPEFETDPARVLEEHSDVAEVLMQARRFRAALADAVELAREQLLTEIAADVLGRELELRPADLRAIVSKAIQRYAFDVPLAVRLHPADVELLRGAYPAVVDSGLRRGDAIVELHVGSIDARLGVRLESLLRSLQ